MSMDAAYVATMCAAKCAARATLPGHEKRCREDAPDAARRGARRGPVLAAMTTYTDLLDSYGANGTARAARPTRRTALARFAQRHPDLALDGLVRPG